MKRRLVSTRSLVAGAALLLASTVFAAEPQGARSLWSEGGFDGSGQIRNEERRQLTPKPGKGPIAVAGMPFDLPSEGVAPSAELSLAVMAGERVVVRETIALPDTAVSNATVSFLAHHDRELGLIRKMEKARPGVLRFTVSAGEKVLVSTTFAEADRGSARLAGGGSVVGSSRMVDVKVKSPRQVSNGMQPDPACESACNDTYVECYYVICDQRGDCSYCWEDYEWCAASCPQVCVEPKSVSTYNTSWTYIGTYNHGQICINNSQAYLLFEDVERRYVYQRTEHCDGTYTDVYQSTQYRSFWCKYYLGPGCIGSFYNPPGNC